jgi:hypothetical protein
MVLLFLVFVTVSVLWYYLHVKLEVNKLLRPIIIPKQKK